MDRRVRRIGWVGAAGSVASGVATTMLLITHPRDEAAYLQYVETYGDYGSLHKENRDAGDAELIAAGDRGCGWLQHRPMALTRTDRRFDIGEMQQKYRGQMSSEDATLPESIVAGAWEYLCPATKALKRTWTPFRDTSAD